jgi:carbon monoxide dehydrogenase subunit G
VLIENEFEVPAPVEEVWAYLLEVEKVAPCMPGAELTETIDDRNWKGKVAVKLGPVSLSFAGTVTMQERDDAAHRVVVKASGMEQRGKGAATALVTSWLEASENATRVRITQDITVSGAVAQYSRGMMQDVSARLTGQFADCLKANLTTRSRPQPGPEEASAAPAAAPPVRGLSLAFWAFFRAVARFFRRLFGAEPTAPAR